MKTFLKWNLLLVCLLSHSIVFSKDYICYYLINTEIKASIEENERQKDMRSEQLENLALEEANKNQWKEYKELTEKIKSRLNSLGLAVQAIPVSVNIYREINKIYQIQDAIYKELSDAPLWIPIATQGQIEFISQLQMNIRLMAGIVLSYGMINQMEKAERKILLDYTQKEIKMMRVSAWNTLFQIRLAKRKHKIRLNVIQNWINRDKKLIRDIIKNAKMY